MSDGMLLVTIAVCLLGGGALIAGLRSKSGSRNQRGESFLSRN